MTRKHVLRCDRCKCEVVGALSPYPDGWTTIQVAAEKILNCDLCGDCTTIARNLLVNAGVEFSVSGTQ